MIVGPDFIWLHFPKCAGTEIEAYLRSRFGHRHDLQFDEVFQKGQVICHHTVAKRRKYDSSFSPGSRTIICCVRRLPTWLLSRVHFGMQLNPEHRVTRKMILRGEFYHEDGTTETADHVIEQFAQETDRWIRLENLKADFWHAFSPYLQLSPEDVKTGLSKQRNRTKIEYIRDPQFYFANDDLEHLYSANPNWAALEKTLYGELLRFSD